MANSLADVAPKILAQGLRALRNMNVMVPLVNSSYAQEFSRKGLSVDIPIPSAIAVQDVTPGPTPPTDDQDVAPTTAQITLNQWKEAPFYLTDKDIQEAMNGVIPMQASEAISSIADNVNSYILGLYKGVYGYAGADDAIPFASDTSEATAVRKVLNNQKAPMGDRRLVLNPDAEGNALNLRAFQDTNFVATPNDVMEGRLTRKLGFSWHMDQQIPEHAAGSITTGAIAKTGTAQTVGTKAVTCTTAASTGAVDLKEGDIVVFAGSTQTHVVTSDVAEASASTDFTLNIEPGLAVALEGDEALTLELADHAVNLAFHRDAIGFASRLLEDTNANQLGSIVQTAVDPITRLALRLEITRQHKQTRFAYDILYGASLIRPPLAARLAGQG